MSYDVYWVKNVQKKIADFEHPTFQGACIIGCTSAIQASLIAFGLRDNSGRIIGCTSAIQASLIAFGLHDNSGRALPTLKCNKFAQNILPILNVPRSQNRHFDQFSSFGMVSVWLRNDIEFVITRKKEIYTNAFFMNFYAPASPLMVGCSKSIIFFCTIFDKKLIS